MNQAKNKKTYLVLSVAAMVVLMLGAVGVSSYATGSTNGSSDTKSTQDQIDTNANDGKSISDGETNDDHTTDTKLAKDQINTNANDGKSISDGDGETNDDNK